MRQHITWVRNFVRLPERAENSKSIKCIIDPYWNVYAMLWGGRMENPKDHAERNSSNEDEARDVQWKINGK